MSMNTHPEASGHRTTTAPQTPSGQVNTAALADVGSTADPVAAAALVVARIRSATFAGRDPDHLVSAEVDADGVVVRIRLAATARGREPRLVEAAVLAAVAAGQGAVERAWHEAASRWLPEGVEHDES